MLNATHALAISPPLMVTKKCHECQYNTFKILIKEYDSYAKYRCVLCLFFLYLNDNNLWKFTKEKV